VRVVEAFIYGLLPSLDWLKFFGRWACLLLITWPTNTMV
jgi:hypothetical protein